MNEETDEVKAIPSDNPDDYLVVEDREKKTTWHLQVKENGTPNHRLMGAAWAALHGGYRGNVYNGPQKREALRKLTKLYEDENMETPTEKSMNDKVGARHSGSDLADMQTVHDIAVRQGAMCQGEAPKSHRKAITDAPNLRGDEMQSCSNCAFFKYMPSEEIHVYGENGPAGGYTEPKGICMKFEFMTQGNYVCDAWETNIPPAVESKGFSNALKTIGKTDDELRVANYIILHGGRDLTGVVPPKYGGGPNRDGSKGEFFSDKTDVESSYTKTGILHVDFEHGYDPDSIGIKKHDVLGYVDWKTAKRDKRGVFVERVLNRRNEYVQWLEELIEQGLIGNSSEAIPEGVEKAVNGEILKWPLHRDTLTVQPMEPRMLTQNAFTAIKHLAEISPQIKTLLNEYVSDETTDESLVTADGETPVTENAKSNERIENAEATAKETKMADNEEGKVVAPEQPAIDYELLAAKVAEKLDVPGAAKAAPAVIKAENLGDPDPYKALARWAMGENVKGLNAFRPADSKNAALTIGENIMTFTWQSTKALKAALQEDTASEGGNLVPNDFFPRIIAKRDEASIARIAGAQVFATSRDYLDIPYEDGSQSDFTEVAEEAAVSESEPTFGNAQARIYNYRRLVKISEELLEDDATNLSEFLSDSTGRAVAAVENSRTLVGTGSGQPQGVFVGGSVGYTFADTNSITAAEVASLFWTLGEPYHEEAVWTMRGATMGQLQSLTGNPFSFMPTPAANTWEKIFYGGKPYYLSDKVAALATGAKTIMIGNWRFYALVERRALTLSRNPYLYQANGQVGLFAGIRFGGVVLQSEAFKWGIQA